MKTSWLAAAALVIILSIWMFSGLLQSDESEQVSTADDRIQASIMTVEARPAQISVMAREIELQGQLEPNKHLLLKAQTSGAVQEIFVRKGARVAAGEELIQLDKGGRANTLAEASAAVKTARSEQAAAQSLSEQRLQSRLQLEQADARLEAAMARLASVTLDISNTTITAPFDSIVNEIPVDVGELIERANVVVELVDDSSFKVSAHASQQMLSQLHAGQDVTVSLITGETLRGSLSYVSSVADPRSRTFAVEASVENPGSTVAAGVSASLHIPVEQVNATFVSPSAMSLGKDGELGVKALDEQNRVEFLPVELISTTLDGAWVSGIPDGQRVITLGQGFVNTGEVVESRLPVNR